MKKIMKNTLLKPRTFLIIFSTSLATLFVAFFGEQATQFLTSVIAPVPEHAPFDGTVYPIKQVPNWVKLTEAERKTTYNSLPADKLIPLPTYQPARLAIPVGNLKWNDPSDDSIRNEKITYSVPYLSSYRLDGLENTGSHPAIDIKIPEGTPIYSIANGTVIKAQMSNDGFGNNIVIQHNNFPSLDDANIKSKIFSSYSHMSTISVQVNQVVRKGDLIGVSGMTGTATTPHLHFQIDNEKALWHPYWPFTGAEMRAAGYSFFDAINKGLRQDNAIAYTINPLKYVQKYFGDQALVASAGPTITPEPVVVADPYDSLSFNVQLTSAQSVQENGEVRAVLQAFTGSGTLLSAPQFSDQVSLSLLSPTGTLNRTTLSATDLQSGIVGDLLVNNLKPGKNKIIVRFRSREFSSTEFEVTAMPVAVTVPLPTPEPVVAPTPVVSTTSLRFALTQDKTTVALGDHVTFTVRALDANDALVTAPLVFEETPTLGVKPLNGTINVTTVTPESFVNGEMKVTFSPTVPGNVDFFISYQGALYNATPVLVEMPVVNSTVDASSPKPFSDIDSGSQYFTALSELKAAGLVTGYGDGTFKPATTVTRAEAVTFILRGTNQTVQETLNLTFPDVSRAAWYAKYVSAAFEMGFVKGYPDGTFRPDATVTLAEFLTMLFVGSKTDIDPNITLVMPLGIVETEWYAPYLQEALRRTIILTPGNNIIDPAQPMSRGDIAEILYRIKNLGK